MLCESLRATTIVVHSMTTGSSALRFVSKGGNVRNCVDVGTDSTRLDIQFDCELESIVDGCDGQDTTGKSWPVRVRLTNGAIVGCDFVVSATGVKPNTGVLGAEFEASGCAVLVPVVDTTQREFQHSTGASFCHYVVADATCRIVVN